MKKYMYLLGAMMFLSISCSKDQPETAPVAPTVVENYAEENSYYAFLSKVIPNATLTNVVSGVYLELGYEFHPLTNGLITSVEIQLPFPRGNTSIHIWDSQTHNLLHTEVINVQSAGVIYKKNISGVALQANKKYVISMTTDAWYRYVRNAANPIARPYTAGNIVIERDANAAINTFPVAFTEGTLHEGGVCFNFIKTN